jgi:hypothetical protein
MQSRLSAVVSAGRVIAILIMTTLVSAYRFLVTEIRTGSQFYGAGSACILTTFLKREGFCMRVRYPDRSSNPVPEFILIRTAAKRLSDALWNSGPSPKVAI